MANPSKSLSPLEQHYNFGAFFRQIMTEADLTFHSGGTLRLGQPAPNFQLPTVDGKIIDLEELRKDGHVAVVFGCASAPPCISELPGYEQIHRDAASLGCHLVFVYGREIHPNEPLPNGKVYPHHVDIEQKTQQARSFRDDHGLTMPICVDDLAGSTHRAYGLMPHLMTVVHRDGKVIHRSEKACAELLRAVLENFSSSSQPIELVHPRDPSNPEERRFEAPPTPTYSETLWMRAHG